jgi:hypothetical protein
MPAVPGLRSNYAKVGRLVYVGRMFDKIRLHAAGSLPADYHANLGAGFDARACSFLRVSHAEVRQRVLAGGSDEEVLAWCEAQGGRRSDEECLWWNSFMMKRGWRDEATPILRQRIVEFGLAGRPIETMFDLNECDEGRDPMGDRAWEKV